MQSQKIESLNKIIQNHVPVPMIIVESVENNSYESLNESNLINIGQDTPKQEYPINILFQNKKFDQEFESLSCLDNLKLNKINGEANQDVIDNSQLSDSFCSQKLSIALQNQNEFIVTVTNSKKQKRDLSCFEEEEKRFQISINKCEWENQQKVAVIVFTNITTQVENIQIEKIKEIDAFKDHLLRTISHDLKTPINYIISILESKTNENITSSINELTIEDIAGILTNCHVLHCLIKNIVDYQDLSDGQCLKLVTQSFTLFKLFQDVERMFRYQYQNKNLDFIIEMPQQLKNVIITQDQFRLKQILLNLISNAIKFTKKGYIKLKAFQTQNDLQQISDQKITFIVEDTGIGIGQDKLKQLFSLQCQHLENMKLDNGIGLGLTIAQDLAIQLGPSKIKIKSELNKGTALSFQIYQNLSQNKELNSSLQENSQQANNSFPDYFFEMPECEIKTLVYLNQNIQKDISQNQVNGNFKYHNNYNFLEKIKNKNHFQYPTQNAVTSSPNKIKVLIVDDNFFNTKSLENLLLSLYKKLYPKISVLVYKSENGLEAIEKVKQESQKKSKFDVIFMDINMPIMDGIQAIKELNNLALQDKIEQQNIIICSANADENTMESSYKNLKINTFLEKPINIQKLQQMMPSFNKINV